MRLAGPWGVRAVALGAALLSGGMIAAGFAPWESASAPLAGLVPLLVLCARRPARECAGWGFVAGLTMWLATLHWVTALHETAGIPAALAAVAWIALAAYCALYTAAFAYAAARWLAWAGTHRVARNAAGVASLALLWTGLEVLRGTLFTGFPWNPLGATLVHNLAVAQAAEWVGVYGLSAVVVWFNASLAFTLLRYLDRASWTRYRPHVELFMGLALLAFLTVWGRQRMIRFGAREGNLVVALAQPAIPQNVKWDSAFVREVRDRFERLTVEASETALVLAGTKPDLTIWPETAMPGDPARDPALADYLGELARRCGPILTGVMAEGEEDVDDWYNSAVLIAADGTAAGRYDKQHLVIFGEYIPLDRVFPRLQALAPLGISLTAGRAATVFEPPDSPGVRLSVTICFEDVIPAISRAFVRNGARLLVNQSNDAWFDGTAQHRQHLNLGVLRCIENRVPGVRVSNSGLSGFIEANGRVYHRGLARVEGSAWLGTPGPLPGGAPASDVGLVAMPGPDWTPGFYTRYGDLALGWPAAVFALGWLAYCGWTARRPGGNGAENDREDTHDA